MDQGATRVGLGAQHKILMSKMNSRNSIAVHTESPMKRPSRPPMSATNWSNWKTVQNTIVRTDRKWHLVVRPLLVVVVN